MTKIICTIGPSSRAEQVLKELAASGMKIARLNFSHGTHAEHEEYIHNIRKINSSFGYKIKILQDLEGFRIRLGKFPEDILLYKGRIIELVRSKESYVRPETEIPLDFDGNFKSLCKGTEIFIDDGNILLQVLFCRKDKLTAKVIIPGILSSNKGINIPGLDLKYDALTAKDKSDIKFGIEHKVDYISQSFVRNEHDMINIQKILKKNNHKCKTIAKIESYAGINNIESIMENSDGIMIARGDMGVSIPIYEVPVVQKQLLIKCRKMKKISIIATQMLESMRHNIRPTRAEVSDVANAVLDCSEYVMLSSETAVGKYPVETVKLMKLIIEFTEIYRSQLSGD